MYICYKDEGIENIYMAGEGGGAQGNLEIFISSEYGSISAAELLSDI